MTSPLQPVGFDSCRFDGIPADPPPKSRSSRAPLHPKPRHPVRGAARSAAPQTPGSQGTRRAPCHPSRSRCLHRITACCNAHGMTEEGWHAGLRRRGNARGRTEKQTGAPITPPRHPARGAARSAAPRIPGSQGTRRAPCHPSRSRCLHRITACCNAQGMTEEGWHAGLRRRGNARGRTEKQTGAPITPPRHPVRGAARSAAPQTPGSQGTRRAPCHPSRSRCLHRITACCNAHGMTEEEDVPCRGAQGMTEEEDVPCRGAQGMTRRGGWHGARPRDADRSARAIGARATMDAEELETHRLRVKDHIPGNRGSSSEGGLEASS